MSNTTTVTHPNGHVSKRTSKNRVYTHAVVVVPATQEARIAAFEAQAKALDDLADRIDAALVNPQVLIQSRGIYQRGEESFNSHEVFLGGALEYSTHSKNSWPAVSVRSNKDGEHETWAEYALGVEPKRETTIAYNGKQQYAYSARRIVLAHAAQRVLELREQADALREKGSQPDPDDYEVIRWSSRFDLAKKAADSEFDTYARISGKTLVVVPVDSKEA